MTDRRAQLSRRWRKAGGGRWGRLYWRANDRFARIDWERGEVARIVDHPLVTHFYSYAALETDIAEMEANEQTRQRQRQSGH